MNGKEIIAWIVKYLEKQNKLCYDHDILSVLRNMDKYMMMQLVNLRDLDIRQYRELQEKEHETSRSYK